MSIQGRYLPSHAIQAADGWQVDRITPISRLYGANGIRNGADGRLYVAQVSGSQVSALDVDSGAIEVISPIGSDIIGPDDLAFDSHGNLFITEYTEGRVSVRSPSGQTRLLNGDIPGANAITVYQDRLFVGECRPGGRIMEMDPQTGAIRVLLDNVMLPNAMEVGPDGQLYFPVMGTNEVWRMPLDGGPAEVVAGNLGVPDAVKFDAQGQIVSTQVHSGQVLRLDPQSGTQTVMANLEAGLDNIALIGDRTFVSHFSGRIYELLKDGTHKNLLPSGFNMPLGLAFADDGALFIADGPYSYRLKPGESLTTAGMLFTPGTPGYVRGVAAEGQGSFVVTTANGNVTRWNPAEQHSEVLTEGYDQLMGIALAPDGAIVFAEWGAGRVLSYKNSQTVVLAAGLDRPSGIAIDDDGRVYVAESGSGRLLRLNGSKTETLLDGLKTPQGLAYAKGQIYVLDVVDKVLSAFDTRTQSQTEIATHLPVGPPEGVILKPLKPVLPLAGAMGHFAGLAVGPDGSLYVSADAEGSVLKISPRT